MILKGVMAGLFRLTFPKRVRDHAHVAFFRLSDGQKHAGHRGIMGCLIG
jgi:hypothetical protein